MRPAIPDELWNYLPPAGWTNAHSLLPSDEDHFYGTETLLGDWGGRTLLLAKDWGPTPWLRDLLKVRGDRGWRHAERERGDRGGVKTNEFIREAAPLLPGKKLYGSATANILYDQESWSRTLPGFWSGPLHEHLKRVLVAVLGAMANFEVVACIGKEAWFLMCAVLGRPDAGRRFKEYRLAPDPVTARCAGKRIAAFAVKHPARGSNKEKWVGWHAMARFMKS